MDQSLTMKAARIYGKSDIRIDDVPVPGLPKGTEIKLKIYAGGICGSDLHEYVVGPSAKRADPHPLTNEKIPITLGHEFSGTIEELGPSVDTSKYHIGDKVSIFPAITCGKCYFCKKKEFYLCRMVGCVGLSGFGGGLSSYVTLPQHMLYVLPKDVSLEAGALVEPLSVAWHAVKKSGAGPGSRVVIFGAGPIGCFILSVLKAKGVEWVAVAEVAKKRLDVAKESGADVVINPLKEDVVKICKEATDGLGCDISFDCAGLESTITSAIMAVRSKGIIVNVAVYEQTDVKININAMLIYEKTLMTALAYDTEDYDEVIKALDKRTIVAEQFITRRIGLQDAVEKGFETLINEKDQHIKILIYPEHSNN